MGTLSYQICSCLPSFLKSLTCLAFDTLKVTLQLPNPYLISWLIYFTARIALQFVDNINMDMSEDYISSCILHLNHKYLDICNLFYERHLEQPYI